MPDLTPITREEMFLDGNTELTPITREEMILAGADIDVITRREWFLKKYRGGGGGGGYQIKDIPNTPCDIATFTDGANLPMPSLKIDIEPIQSGSGDPSPSNIRPISGWSGANVHRTGVNLYDLRTNRYMQGVEKLKVGDTLYIRTDYEINYKLYIRYSGDNLATEYTIPLNETVTITLDRTIVAIALSEPDANSIISNNKEFTISLAPIDEVIPYNGHTTTIPFTDAQGNPITVYGGECDVVNGTSRNEKTLGSVDMGTLNWSMQAGSGNQNARFVAPLSGAITSISLPLCSIYRSVNDPVYDRIQDKVICLAGGNVYVEDNDYTSASAFKTAMNGAQLVYKLATPSTFNTQPTAIKSLEGTNNVWGDCGQITEGSYFSESEEE